MRLATFWKPAIKWSVSAVLTFSSSSALPTASRILFRRNGKPARKSFTSSAVPKSFAGERFLNILCRIVSVTLRRTASFGLKLGARVLPTWSNCNSVLPSIVSSVGTYKPVSAATLPTSSNALPTSICCRLLSFCSATSLPALRRNSGSVKSSRVSLMRRTISMATSESPSLIASNSFSNSSCMPGVVRPIMPRSSSAILRSSVRKIFPGCGSA